MSAQVLVPLICLDSLAQARHFGENMRPNNVDYSIISAVGEDAIAQAPHGSHLVCLVSAGWNREGGRYLTQWMPFAKWETLWHRIDLLFNASEHLNDWGTATAAQDQFDQLYPWHTECFEWLEPYVLQETFVAPTAHSFICKSGHHRSVAFVEKFTKYLRAKHPGVRIWVWHLDHTRRHRETGRRVLDLDYFENMRQNDQETYLEFPLVNAITSRREGRMPQTLLHDQFPLSCARNVRRRRTS